MAGTNEMPGATSEGSEGGIMVRRAYLINQTLFDVAWLGVV